jgi:excinuclease ABC subunit C
VVFKDGKPSKADYRHFKVKTVEGPNDFATMEEVVYRRYRRLTEEEQPLPQLIIIDGGKGQLGAALNSLHKLNIANKVAVVGIAKKLEELYVPNDPFPLHIDKKSGSLKLIQQLRNEAHRFGITFHRDLRSKDMLESELEHIPHVAKKSAEKLLIHFKSINNIRNATLKQLTEVVNLRQAKAIQAFFEEAKGEEEDMEKED